jgi:DNA-binding NarL/FixJ family response regulator
MNRIAIVDDHTMIRQGLRRIIEEMGGYKVVGEAGDGLDILPLIRKTHPHLIILDISLPKLRGIEAIRKLRKTNKRVKILVLTMHKNEHYVYECLAAGAQGYILKEDADTELLAAIEAIKTGDTYVSKSFSNQVIEALARKKMHEGSGLDILTEREREVLRLIAEGKTNKRIADVLSISKRTVEHHRLHVMKKLDVSNVADLVKIAIKHHLVDIT